MITCLVNALLHPEYSFISITSPKIITLYTGYNNNYTLFDQYSIKDTKNSTLSALKKPNDKKCKKLRIKYYSRIAKLSDKNKYAYGKKDVFIYQDKDAKTKSYNTFDVVIRVHLLKVLHRILIILIYLIYLILAMDQLAAQIINAINLEKEAIQNSIALLNNTIINTTNEMKKSIEDIRPAQNYGLPQSMKISKIIVKDTGKMQIDTEGSDKEIAKQEIEKEMNTIKENFWTTKLLNSNTYCKKCQQVKHKDNNCKFICNLCNGDHQASICTHKLHCKWCGQRKGEHKCEAFEHVYRTKIKCPICKLKGHFGKECNLLFLALSTNWKKNNNINRRRRKFRTRLGTNLKRNNRRIAFRTK